VLATGAGLLVPGKSPGRVDKNDKPVAPAVEVTVMRPIRRTTGDFQEFNGQIIASATVDVRSRITSQIEKVAFQPGAKVKRGDLLFELDARPYQIEFQRAQAEVQRAEGSLKRARTALAHVEVRLKAAVAGEEEAATARGAVDEAQAGMLVAKAGLERAKLDLDATRLTSPIDGQTGGTVLGVGNLATPAATLVTVVMANPVYVSFGVDDHAVLALRKLLQHGDVTAKLALAREADFSHTAKIAFVDNRVDLASGQIHVRAVLPNSGGDILPGMFARVRLILGEPREELALPNRAVRRTHQNLPFVLIAGPGDVIEWRAVGMIGETANGELVVGSGVGPNDRVIIDESLPAAGVSIRVHEADPPK
jgi:RND family efflux transporter MFP subunit